MKNVHVNSLRLSLNGIEVQEITSLFNVIKKLKLPITFSRVSNRAYSYSRTDLILEGKFTQEAVQKITETYSKTIEISFDVSSNPTIINQINYHSALLWELEHKVYIGTTIFPIEVMKKIIPVDDNLHFIKLLLMTPAAHYLNNFLITKPKGIVSIINSKYLHFLLPAQRIDFLYLWLEKLEKGEVPDFDWISGSTGELNEKYTLKTQLAPELDANLEKWLEISRNQDIIDYNLAYGRQIEIVARNKL